jgi:hypothetical protein
VIRPKNRNTPIDTKRFGSWTGNFGSFRTPINRNAIEEWLQQFDTRDQDLAARILDAVLYFEISAIASNFRAVLKSMVGWNIDPKKRKGRWFFVAMSGSAGESGDTMLREFRRANGLTSRNYNNLFITRSDIVRQQLTNADTIVFIDDFSGTGKQVCDFWNDPEYAFGELTAGVGTVYLILVAATTQAKSKIATETPIEVINAHSLTSRDDIFSDSCTHFTTAEKATVLGYTSFVDKRNPKGWGDCGLLVVFSHGCPNNSIPILHKTTGRWTALFPRHD